MIKNVAEGEVFVGGFAEDDANIVASKVVECAEKVELEEIEPDEVELVFNSTYLFGPEVEKPKFKINEVISPDFNLGVAGSAEDFVLQVAREIYKVNSKVLVLRNVSGSGTSGLEKVTPAVPKRKIKLPAYLCSPFFQNFGSSSMEISEPIEASSIKGVCPFGANIGNLPYMYASEDFYNWLETGLILNKNRKKFYSKQENTISPSFNLGSELISEKMWFHTMEYGSSNLSNSHVNVFFHYLRKLSKYNPACWMNFTSTDCNFKKKLVSTCGLIAEYAAIEFKFSANQDVLDVINGYGLAFSSPYYSVDFVLFPIWLSEQKHWLLAILDFHGREIRKNYSSGTSIDSGVIMMSIAKYFFMEKNFPKDSFDISSHRSRITYLFYPYGVLKQIHGYESEAEYFDHDDGHDPGKKTRGGIAQTRK
ncbi:hypothetical protein POM88_027109 [Heracleum sosnowskyi]|uniref:Ubiquitin-like protease family profile domain-containing protein n=1 Tax=Heracleum sosnowskyi TaxID=360622 RepID=A0AAD8IAC6_9APIA|nr:hypothetical protein POM88_027109 [Heracleum sosnowskyi]